MDERTTLNEICKLVDDILDTYSTITDKWCEYREKEGIVRFNQKSTKISDLSDKEKSMNAIIQYVSFLNSVQEIRQFDYRKEGFVVNSRVKNINSVQEKYDDYLSYRPEKGKIQVNKCFNDLFGVRAIIDCDNLSTDNVRDALKDHTNVEVHDKSPSKGKECIKYTATHLYFKENNYEFRWELQIWESKNERTNQESHKTHRYKYRDWESEAMDCDKTLHYFE